MPYTEPFVYLRANGFFSSIATPVDEWSVGFKILAPTGLVPTGQITSFLETVAPAFSTFHTGTGWQCGTNCFLAELTAAVIGTDGKYVGGGAQSTIVRPYGTPVAGSGTGIHPFTTAVVISLRTTLQRGRASNGRAYWPALGRSLDATTGGLQAVSRDAMATAAATLLSAINAAAESQMPATMGVWVMSNLDAGLSAPVTSIRVGSKVDSQERREKSIEEQYTSENVTPVIAVLDQLQELNFGESPQFQR